MPASMRILNRGIRQALGADVDAERSERLMDAEAKLIFPETGLLAFDA